MSKCVCFYQGRFWGRALCCSSPWYSTLGKYQCHVWRTGHRWMAGLAESVRFHVRTGAARWSAGCLTCGWQQNRRHQLCSWSWHCSGHSNIGGLEEEGRTEERDKELQLLLNLRFMQTSQQRWTTKGHLGLNHLSPTLLSHFRDKETWRFVLTKDLESLNLPGSS